LPYVVLCVQAKDRKEMGHSTPTFDANRLVEDYVDYQHILHAVADEA
jgi:hypothetical protein